MKLAHSDLLGLSRRSCVGGNHRCHWIEKATSFHFQCLDKPADEIKVRVDRPKSGTSFREIRLRSHRSNESNTCQDDRVAITEQS